MTQFNWQGLGDTGNELPVSVIPAKAEIQEGLWLKQLRKKNGTSHPQRACKQFQYPDSSLRRSDKKQYFHFPTSHKIFEKVMAIHTAVSLCQPLAPGTANQLAVSSLGAKLCSRGGDSFCPRVQSSLRWYFFVRTLMELNPTTSHESLRTGSRNRKLGTVTSKA
jgi:hypothetical protein